MAIWARLMFAVLNLASVMFGVLFLYASIIFGQFYFGESMEPRKTRIIKFLRKLSILQHLKQLIDRQTETHPFCFCYFILYIYLFFFA